ncbi:MAG TPA: pyridoxine 5'-phosphate synthase [Stellaceae bacterium]|nr:pyridoxine 5'-phosphate synthase [Stellaceae bacterium]
MTRLSVNLNKIALLRNSRRTGVPDPVKFAHIARAAGADGITVHPRPDERHIRRSDVPALTEIMLPWRPAMELNIEGNPDEIWLGIVEQARPEQATLVPDAADAFTSEAGWHLAEDAARLRPLIARLKRIGSRVVLFVDPDCADVERARDLGAHGIEIYTGAYAAAFRRGDPAAALAACVATARKAVAAGLVVNIGHDLNLDNLPPLIAAMPPVAEASIGHELTADALVMGFAAAIRAYKAALNPGKG